MNKFNSKRKPGDFSPKPSQNNYQKRFRYVLLEIVYFCVSLWHGGFFFLLKFIYNTIKCLHFRPDDDDDDDGVGNFEMELANMDMEMDDLLGDGPENQQTNIKWVRKISKCH